MTIESNEGEPGWPQLHRVRRAIVVVDMVESVRLMQQHEDGVIDRWRRFVHEVRTDVLPQHGGRMVKSLGDGMLLEFQSMRSAMAAGLEVQSRVAPYNEQVPADARIQLRLGVHAGDVVSDSLDIYGAGVNLAARLAGAGSAGDIVVSAEARDELADGLDAEFEDLGDLYLKHVAQPVRAFTARAARTSSPQEPPMPPVEDLRPVLVIIPFQCRSGDDTQHVLGDLIVDELTALLSRVSEWRVISKLSASAFARRDFKMHELQATLKTDYVAYGAYSLDGDRVRLQPQLVDCHSGEVLWADAVTEDQRAILSGSAEVFATISHAIASALFGHGMRRVAALPLPRLDSHALLLASVALMHRARRSEFESAREVIEHLQERHPRAAQPHAWRAKWHVLRVVQGWSQDTVRDGDEALTAGNRAADSDSSSSLALSMQGLVHAYLKHDFDAAAVCYDEALALNPNESLALLLKGVLHAFLGEGAQAYPLTQHSLTLSPLDPMRYFYLSLSAAAAISAQRYDEAIDLATRSLMANRTHLSTYRSLAIAQSLSGRVQAARSTVQELLCFEPGFTVSRFLQRYPGTARAPDYAQRLADALAQAGLPR